MKLTSLFKQTLANKAAQAKFADEIREKQAYLKVCGDTLYFREYTQYFEDMDRLPPEAFAQVSSLFMVAPDKSTRSLIEMSQSRRVFAVHMHSLNLPAPTWEFSNDVNAVLSEIAKLKDRRDSLKASLERTLRPFNTFAQLLKAWPEAQPFVDAMIKKAPAMYPPALIPGAITALIEKA